MPRGRPKGSKNKNSKTSTVIPKSLEGRDWGVREIAHNKLTWRYPSFEPYMTKEEAEAEVKKLLDSKIVAEAHVINMRVASSGETAIVESSTEDGETE